MQSFGPTSCRRLGWRIIQQEIAEMETKSDSTRNIDRDEFFKLVQVGDHDVTEHFGDRIITKKAYVTLPDKSIQIQIWSTPAPTSAQ
jgi:hypothetical protein